MFKLLEQDHVVFAKHSNWLVKVPFGGLTGLNWGSTRLFLWLWRSPRPSSQVRLQILDKTLEFNKTILAEKEQAFFTRINRIGLLEKLHSPKWSKERKTVWFLRRNHKHS